MRFFEPNDFKDMFYNSTLPHVQMEAAANLANDKIWREGQPVYAFYTDRNSWHICSEAKNAKRRALLINLETIETCNHPREKVKYKDYVHNEFNQFVCECGAKVKPKEFEEIKMTAEGL